MTAPEPTPTAEHTDAVARRMSTREWGEWSSAYHADFNRWTWDGDGRTDMERAEFRDYADAILTSTDPAVHAAMLDALVRAGVLTEHTFQSFGGKWTLTLSTEPRAIDQDEALDLLRKRLTGGVAP